MSRAVLLLVGVVALAGCPRREPPPPPPPKIVEGPPPMQEQRLTVPGPELALGPIGHTVSADGQHVFVDGKVRNKGIRPTREVKITVSGLDQSGQPVVSVVTNSTPELINPGSSAPYLARLPNLPSIRTFHVEAVGK